MTTIVTPFLSIYSTIAANNQTNKRPKLILQRVTNLLHPRTYNDTLLGCTFP